MQEDMFLYNISEILNYVQFIKSIYNYVQPAVASKLHVHHRTITTLELW